MSELKHTQNTLYDHLFFLEQQDTLGVLTSTREIVLRAQSVSIDAAKIAGLATHLLPFWQTGVETGQPVFSTAVWPEQYHFFDGTERTVNWILLLDALNFCFWGEKGEARWQIAYRGEMLNGYLAEAASLRRAVEEQVPLWDAAYLSNIGQQEFAAIFRGPSPGGISIPLLEERWHAAREVGQVLQARFAGQFARLVEQASGSAVALTLALAEHFSSFCDRATYDHCQVSFLKRAQICVADLYGAFQGQSWGAFSDLDGLTIFADYKLPQVLRHWEVLVYAPALAEKVDDQQTLPAGGREEVEIRAATIWASELVRRAVGRLGARPVTAVEIDQLLWHLGQDSGAMQPYHRVRTLYY